MRRVVVLCALVMVGCPPAPARSTEPLPTSSPPSAAPPPTSSAPPPSTASIGAAPTVTASPPPIVCDDELPTGSLPQWKSCVAPSTCILAHRTCCAPCTMPQACGVVAVGTPFVSALSEKVCGTATPKCPACEGGENPNLHAACRKGRCTTVDLAVDASSACTKDDECVARAPDCCGACGPGGAFVALRKDAVATYVAEVCGKTKCAQCQSPPTPPKAVCDPKTKHCAVAP